MDISTISDTETKMYGWERLSNMCSMGCRVFLSPWAQNDKLPYDAVFKDEFNDGPPSDTDEAVTNEPQKPIWSDMKISAPIVKTQKSNSVSNLKIGPSYEKVPFTASTSRMTDKRASKTDISASRTSLTASQEKLHIAQMVTTV